MSMSSYCINQAVFSCVFHLTPVMNEVILSIPCTPAPYQVTPFSLVLNSWKYLPNSTVAVNLTLFT